MEQWNHQEIVGACRKSFVPAWASWNLKYSSQNQRVGPKNVEKDDEYDKRAYSSTS